MGCLRSRIGAWACSFTLLTVSARGVPASPYATLSWDPVNAVSDLSSQPDGVSNLFLWIHESPGIRSVAITLAWTPSAGANSYRIMSASTSACNNCGYVSLDQPDGGFLGDSSFSTSIHLPSISSDRIGFTVMAPTGGNVSATFCARSVQILDSENRLWQLPVEGTATILGGAEGAVCPPEIYSVTPNTVLADDLTQVSITGNHLSAETLIEFQSKGGSITTTATEYLDSHTLMIGVRGSPSQDVVAVARGASTLADTLNDALSIAEIPKELYVPNRVIVQFKPGLVRLPEGNHPSAPAGLISTDGGLAYRLTTLGVQAVAMLTPTATEENLTGKDAMEHPIPLDRRQLDWFVLRAW